MEKLSVYIVTLNEEERLPRTLEAAQKVADELIVVDSGSTDKTCEIAQSYGAKVIFHKWHTYSDQKYYAEQQCQYNYVLMVDADEVLSDELIEEILQVKKNPSLKVYNITISNMYQGDKTPSRFSEKFTVVRLYDKRVASMPKEAGNKDRVFVPSDIKIGNLKGKIHHYCILSIEQAVDKYNKHSTEMQKTLIAEGRSFSKLRLFTEFPFQFLKYYFMKRLFLLGTNGFIRSMTLAYFRFLKIAKWHEYHLINKEKK